MTKTRKIELGDRSFEVPLLPLRVNRVVYPLCRNLMLSDLFGRAAQNDGHVTEDEDIAALETIAFEAARAADPEFTQEQFDELPISSVQLLQAFWYVRYQTGTWVEIPLGEVAKDPEGEATGAESPQQ